MLHRSQLNPLLIVTAVFLFFASPLWAQEQSRESMANDSTASQWSFQFAYEWTDYYTDEIEPGVTRPEGNQNLVQFRVVAPFKVSGLSILPRVTFRNVQAKDGSSGRGNAELFGLIIPIEWATGRFGIGPQVNFPAEEDQLGTKAWRYGFATAVLQRAANDKIMTGLLVQQVWGKTDTERPDETVASPLTIQPVFNYALPGSWYINIGETAFRRDWDTGSWIIPIGIRLGKLFIGDKDTWNVYGEYRRTVVYKDWPGAASKNSFRLNVSYTIPVG
jgi:hypothetical protein